MTVTSGPAPPIRPAQLADVDRLAAVHARAFEHPWDAKALAGAMASSLAYTLQAGEPALGFIVAQAVAGEAEILTLAVAPDARRRGVGLALLQAAAALARSRGAGTLWLEVAEDNDAARALYAAAGFEAAGRRKAYYRRPSGAVDALMLKRSLNTGAPSPYGGASTERALGPDRKRLHREGAQDD